VQSVPSAIKRKPRWDADRPEVLINGLVGVEIWLMVNTVRIPTKAATYSNLIAATIPI
jgi:hypothetical protein